MIRSTTESAPHVVIIGGGGTGLALAYDLTLQGIRVSLFEQGELTSGTTGRHHGQLHSGARYAVTDPETARECYEESVILRRIAAQSIEYNRGLFVAVTLEDEEYLGDFLRGCEAAGIPAEPIGADEARGLEPALSERVRLAVIVPDGTIDAFRLPMQFAAAAASAGARIHPFHRVVEVRRRSGQASGVSVLRLSDGARLEVDAQFVVNAGGAWAGGVADVAGVSLAVTPSPGSMLALTGRLTDMVISRLHPPGDGDILVPQRNLSIIGSTQRMAPDPDGSRPLPGDEPLLHEAAALLVPAARKAAPAAIWAASRPLAGKAPEGSEEALRGLSRNFECIRQLPGFMSIVGGKATVLRRMGECAAREICTDLGMSYRNGSSDAPLPDYRQFYRRAYGAVGSRGAAG